ncbi:MAG: hypothetical protein JWO80_976 [Bryobacterales bacterium]|nr:hypothetical protein [Bryobacterales bacterium]
MKILTVLACACALTAADFPQAEISNGEVRAKLYLPDAETGYYRGTRFDWSGVIASLEYKGHNYFGQWFDKYDPKLHDAISGPVEEFLTDGAGLGYADAKPGGTFIKIGVGVVRKPEESEFHQFHTYEIVDPGKWTIHKKGDSVQFIQDVKDASGYAYRYTKTVRLVKGKPELVLEHSLKNTGTRVIESKAYDHNFFVIDKQPSGPDFSVKFAFALKATRDLKGAAETRGNELLYLRELPKGESVYTGLEGYGDTPKDYDITVENRKAGAGVHITADRPLANMVFWSIRTTLCPEAYVSMRIEPGHEYKWRIAYNFYTTGPAGSLAAGALD